MDELLVIYRKKQHKNPYKTHERVMSSSTNCYPFKLESKPPFSVDLHIKAARATWSRGRCP